MNFQEKIETDILLGCFEFGVLWKTANWIM